jgi:hypothetical protein
MVRLGLECLENGGKGKAKERKKTVKRNIIDRRNQTKPEKTSETKLTGKKQQKERSSNC